MIEPGKERSLSRPESVREKSPPGDRLIQGVLETGVASIPPAGPVAIPPRREDLHGLTFGPTRIGGPSA